MRDLWFSIDGATLSQHTDTDSKWPGWQKDFGPGTYVGNADFNNDDASHIQVDDGFTAVLREHGPSDSRYPGVEHTITGPDSVNLTNIGFNDKLSEMTVSGATPSVISGCTDTTATNYNSSATIEDGSCVFPTDPNLQQNIPDDPGDVLDNPVPVDDLINDDLADTSTAGVGGDNKTLLYVGIGVVAILGLMYLTKK